MQDSIEEIAARLAKATKTEAPELRAIISRHATAKLVVAATRLRAAADATAVRARGTPFPLEGVVEGIGSVVAAMVAMVNAVRGLRAVSGVDGFPNVQSSLRPVVEWLSVTTAKCFDHALTRATSVAIKPSKKLGPWVLDPSLRLASAISEYNANVSAIVGTAPIVGRSSLRVMMPIAVTRAIAMARGIQKADGMAASLRCDEILARVLPDEEPVISFLSERLEKWPQSDAASNVRGSHLSVLEVSALSFAPTSSLAEEYRRIFSAVFTAFMHADQAEVLLTSKSADVMASISSNPHPREIETIIGTHWFCRQRGSGLFGLPSGTCPRSWQFQTVEGRPSDVTVIESFIDSMQKLPGGPSAALRVPEISVMFVTALSLLHQWALGLFQRHPADFHTNDLCVLFGAVQKLVAKLTDSIESPTPEVKVTIDRFADLGGSICEEISSMSRTLSEAAVADVADTKKQKKQGLPMEKKKKKPQPGDPTEFASVIVETVLGGSAEAMESLPEELRADLLSRSFVTALEGMLQSEAYWKKLKATALDSDMRHFASWAEKMDARISVHKPRVVAALERARLLHKAFVALVGPNKKPNKLQIATLTSDVIQV